MIFGSPFIFKSKTLNSLEAPWVPIALPLWTSTVVQSSCQLFCLSVVKPPNGRPCEDSICAHVVSPENNPLISYLVVWVIQVADILGIGQRKRRGV